MIYGAMYSMVPMKLLVLQGNEKENVSRCEQRWPMKLHDANEAP
jgi:hypothetical protein